MWRTSLGVACALVLAAGCGGHAAPAVRPVPAALTIDAPANGATTTARSVEVSGRAPIAPGGGYEIVTVRVDGRPVGPEYRQGGYRTEVALGVGRNAITSEARLFGANGQRLGVLSSGPTVVTRRRDATTGDLDLATAYLVATASPAARGLCGHRRGCVTQPSCFAVGPHRADCPVARSTAAAPITRCAVVVTVRLRGTRVLSGSYGCSGRTGSRPQRFVRPGAGSAERRFRTDAAGATTPNPYGVPRIDAHGDTFIP